MDPELHQCRFRSPIWGRYLVLRCSSFTSTTCHQVYSKTFYRWFHSLLTSISDALTLQTDFNNLIRSVRKKWKMEFHHNKCNVLTISNKFSPIKFCYKLHNHTLKPVNVKYIGCQITSDLGSTNHINTVCSKVNKALGFLRRNLNIGSTKTKQNAYTSSRVRFRGMESLHTERHQHAWDRST